MAVAALLDDDNTATVSVSLSRQQQRGWSPRAWSISLREQHLPADVCFVEEEEGAQTFQTGWRGVNNCPQRRAAAATL